jgi:hypothetical protein
VTHMHVRPLTFQGLSRWWGPKYALSAAPYTVSRRDLNFDGGNFAAFAKGEVFNRAKMAS